MFLQGFHVNFALLTLLAPTEMDAFGTSLTIASPFLALAFWGRWPRPVLAAAWTTVAVILLQLLLYFVNGWIQVNAQRYALDFIPLLMVLAAEGTKRVSGRWWQIAILWAIALNVVALVIVPILARVMSGL